MLEAAMNCFWAKGYESTPMMRNLSEHMGLTGASLHNAFGDKRSLYRRALDDYLEQSVHDRTASLNRLPPFSAIGAFFDESIERMVTNRTHAGCLLVNSALETAPYDPEFRKRSLRNWSTSRRSSVDPSRPGSGTGLSSRQPAAQLAKLLLSVLLGIRVLARTRPQREILEILYRLLRRAISLSSMLRALCMPWLLLAARIWLGPVVFVHRIMMMMTGGEHAAPAALEALMQGAGPLLLAAGLMTRPIALVLLLETVSGPYVGFTASATGPKAVLLAWLLVMGPGALSLDRLLGRGLAWIPSRAVRLMHQFYAWMDRAMGPLLRLALRASVAAAIITSALPAFAWIRQTIPGAPDTFLGLPVWSAALIAVLLTLGCATRPAAFILACMVPLASIATSMDDRFAVLLLLLMLAASGAGVLSVDYLLARWACGASGQDTAVDDALPHVVVVGGGFGGVTAVQGLREAACRITLIDQRNHHLFQPLLYQVATAALSPGDIATPIRSLFRGQRNVRVHLAEVTGIDLAARDVLLGSTRMNFDMLVLATGARHSYFGRDEWAPFAPGLKSIEDATSIRSRLLRAFEEAENASDEAERVAWLTFVIVGGGPTGIELAGAIAELARHGMDKEYRTIDPAKAQVILVHSGPRVLPTFAPALSAAAGRSLRALDVDIRLDARVREVDGSGVEVGNNRITARTVLWAAGVAASPAAQWLGQAADASGRVAVGADLSVPDLPGIYAIGDTAASRGWRGGPVPGLAAAAKQQGRYVARVIGAGLTGRPPPPPFRYRHFGSLATIGRQAAVAELGAVRLWGALAWWFWGATHIVFLVGGRNRATVILDWLWAYLTYRRSTRLITRAMPDATLITRRSEGSPYTKENTSDVVYGRNI